MSKVENPVIVTIMHGFYYFGNEISAPEGYISINKAAKFGGFGGKKGEPGVCKGHPEATVTLDRYEPSQVLLFPLSAVLCIAQSVNLYEFKGTTIRG